MYKIRINKLCRFVSFLKTTIVLFITCGLMVCAHTEDTNVFYEPYSDTSIPYGYTDWRLMEGNHSASNHIYYQLSSTEVFENVQTQDNDIIDATYLISQFRDGALRWSNSSFNNGVNGTASFNVREALPNEEAQTIVSPVYDDDAVNPYVARVRFPAGSYSNNHIICVPLELNVAHMGPGLYAAIYNKEVAAHELGHVIGLADLDAYNANNDYPCEFSHVLMGYNRQFVINPTDSDIKGAAVILGIHKNSHHVFNQYGIFHIPGGGMPGNQYYIENPTTHRKICSLCDGYQLAPHSYTKTSVDSSSHVDKCSQCSYTNQNTSAAHSIVDATCTKAKGCTQCNYVEGAPLEHKLTSSTCTEASSCSRCGLYVGPALGHSYGPPTKCNSSVHIQTCTNGCNAPKYTSHSFNSWTNTDNTTHTRSCVCSEIQTGTHSGTGSWTSDTGSFHRRSCSTCSGYERERHIWDGCTDTKCNTCNYTRTAPGHVLTTSSWMNVGQSGCCQARTKSCVYCSYRETETKNHTYGSCTNYNASTHRKTCSTCGYVISSSHSFSAWKNYNSAFHRRTCSLCSRAETQSHVLNATGTVCISCGFTGPFAGVSSVPVINEDY